MTRSSSMSLIVGLCSLVTVSASWNSGILEAASSGPMANSGKLMNSMFQMVSKSKEGNRLGDHCPKNAFTADFLGYGTTNIMEKLYLSFKAAVARKEKTTYLLPYVRNDGCTIPLEGFPSRYESFDHLFDREHFTKLLRRNGICVDDGAEVPAKYASNQVKKVKKVVFPELMDPTECMLDTSFRANRTYENDWFYITVPDFNVDGDPFPDVVLKDLNDVEHHLIQYPGFVAFREIAIRPNPTLEKRIQKIQKKLGNEYLSVHMRIEEEWADSWTQNGKCYINGSEIVSNIVANKDFQLFRDKVKKKTGKPLKVFVATGNKKGAKKAWKGVKDIEFWTAEDFVEDLGQNQRAMIDQELCLRSKMWVGTKAQSSFSRLIHELRTVKGKGAWDYGYSKSNTDGSTLYEQYDTVEEFHCFS